MSNVEFYVALFVTLVVNGVTMRLWVKGLLEKSMNDVREDIKSVDEKCRETYSMAHQMLTDIRRDMADDRPEDGQRVVALLECGKMVEGRYERRGDRLIVGKFDTEFGIYERFFDWSYVSHWTTKEVQSDGEKTS